MYFAINDFVKLKIKGDFILFNVISPSLSKSTKKKRLAHFKKYSKYDDDNPAAYKPAPGDARAKTKPSKHTLKYRRMYGEDAVQIAKKKIEREKMVDKMKHARMLDRAKVRKIKNRSKADA